MTARMNRRQVLAFIALADAPAPKQITFRSDERLCLDLERIADLRPWGAAFGMASTNIERAVGKQLRFKSGGRPMASAMVHLEWQGLDIVIDATEHVDSHVDQLDDATRAQLQAIAAGGENA